MFRMMTATALVALMSAGAVGAEQPAPFPEFSAKRVTPPKRGAKRRITV